MEPGAFTLSLRVTNFGHKSLPVNPNGYMDFLTITTNLGDLGMTLEEMASALGVSRSLVKAARLDPSSPNYRKPPPHWREKFLAAARLRGSEFVKLADELEG